MLIFALAVVVFENALVCYSFTVADHHVVLCSVVLLIEFAPSLYYHTSIGKILEKISSPHWKTVCLNALLSLSRTAYDTV